MDTFKVGFGYKAEHGKDTACGAIVRIFGDLYGVRHYAFGDALRSEVAAAVFDQWMQDMRDEPFDAAHAMEHMCKLAAVNFDPAAPVLPGYPFGKQRALYQWWGTEYRRAEDEHYWVKRLEERIRREAPAYAVISDMRFENEFYFCDYRVRMDRPGYFVFPGSNHVSECALDRIKERDWDHVISAQRGEDVEAQALEFFRSRFQPQGVIETFDSIMPCAEQIAKSAYASAQVQSPSPLHT